MLGELRHHPGFASRYVASRNVDVWLPPRYQEAANRSFPVVYMHDGQNLFDPKTSPGHWMHSMRCIRNK
ncbi:MAG: alpha/beta hydrolase-fold protein [Candidatus Binatia bacterium]